MYNLCDITYENCNFKKSIKYEVRYNLQDLDYFNYMMNEHWTFAISYIHKKLCLFTCILQLRLIGNTCFILGTCSTMSVDSWWNVVQKNFQLLFSVSVWNYNGNFLNWSTVCRLVMTFTYKWMDWFYYIKFIYTSILWFPAICKSKLLTN